MKTIARSLAALACLTLLSCAVRVAGDAVRAELPVIALDSQPAPEGIGAGFSRMRILSGGTVAFDGYALVKDRGGELAVRTVDAEGADANVSLFDFPPEHRFAVKAYESDGEFARSEAAAALWRGLGHWAPSAVRVLVTVDGGPARDCVFAETVCRDRGRIDVDSLESTDYDAYTNQGGYVLRSVDEDSVDAEEQVVVTMSGRILRVEYPGLANSAQLDYLRSHLSWVESGSGEYGLESRMDVDAFADAVAFYCITGIDPRTAGFYLSKRRNGTVSFAYPGKTGRAFSDPALTSLSDFRNLALFEAMLADETAMASCRERLAEDAALLMAFDFVEDLDQACVSSPSVFDDVLDRINAFSARSF